MSNCVLKMLVKGVSHRDTTQNDDDRYSTPLIKTLNIYS